MISELRDLARRGDGGAEALACAIERVPGLADAVLRIANGPDLGRGARIAGVRRAVVVLGARAVVEIALAVLEPVAPSRLGEASSSLQE